MKNINKKLEEIKYSIPILTITSKEITLFGLIKIKRQKKNNK